MEELNDNLHKATLNDCGSAGGDRPELSPMSLLFNLCQANQLDVVYTVVEQSGPSHNRDFKGRFLPLLIIIFLLVL